MLLAAAADVFLERWYDDVTLAELAKRARVSGQTVINHYGGKEQLATAAYERLSEQITLRRYTPEPGDIEGAVKALAGDLDPPSDVHSTGATKKHLAGVLLRMIATQLGARP